MVVRFGLGGGEEFLSFPGSEVGQGGVAAGDEAFAGVVGVIDLGQVRLVKQGLLHRPAGDEPGD